MLDRFGMTVELTLGIVVPIFKGKGNIRSCNCHRAALPNGVHSASTWGPQKNTELHIHNEGIMINATSDIKCKNCSTFLVKTKKSKKPR